MNPPVSRFSTFVSVVSRAGARWLAAAALATGSLAVSGCNEESEQLGSLTDSYQKHLDEKEKELTSLRNSEKALQTQIAEIKGKLEAMDAEVKASRAKTVDAASIARELAPLLSANRGEPARPAEGETAKAGSPAPPTGSAPRTGTKANNNGVRSTGDNRRQIPLNWDGMPPAAR